MILMIVDTDVNTHLDVDDDDDDDDDDDHPPHKNALGLFSKTITSAASLV